MVNLDIPDVQKCILMKKIIKGSTKLMKKIVE